MNASGSVSPHTFVSQDEWLAARRDLLNEEKQLTKQQQRVAAARRQLPWMKVTKEYVFDTPKGKVRLADLFGGRSQLTSSTTCYPSTMCASGAYPPGPDISNDRGS